MRSLQVPAGIAPRIGGPAVAVLDAAQWLPKAGVETTIFAPDLAVGAQAKKRFVLQPSELPAAARDLDVRLFPTRWPTRLIFSPSLYAALGRELASFDIVHTHSLWTFPQYAVYRQAERHRVPYVVAPCGALDPWLRRNSPRVKAVTTRVWQRDMLNRAAVIQYKTRDEADRARELGITAPVEIVPNGIDWGAFQDLPDGREFRDAHLGGHEGPVVMNLGRIEERKRLDVLISAFARVRMRVDDVKLAIVGPDDVGTGADLVALADELGVREHVVFTGVLRGRDKLAALAGADIWCLPSHFENFGLAVVEAMAAGVATVISPEVQISEEARAAGAALVPEITTDRLADTLASILLDDELRAQLVRGGREFARGYDWSVVAPQIAEMYATAVRRHGQAARARGGRHARRSAA